MSCWFILVNMRKNILSLCLAGGAVMASIGLNAANPSLPTVDRGGKCFYYYSPERGESVFGILSRYGWDENIFRQYNPGVTELKKGQVLYYPCENEAVAVADTVVSAETATAVSQPDRDLAVAAPVCDANELIMPLPARTIEMGEEPSVYIVKDGDTLLSLAREYHTTVADIFALNPRLTYTGVMPGTLVKLLPGSELKHVAARELTARRQAEPKKYKVRKQDTWLSIASANGISVEDLKSANGELRELKPGKNIILPQFIEVRDVRDVLVLDKRETTPDGLRQIYNESRGAKESWSEVVAPSDVNVVLLVNTATADRKRNVEFMRGFMLGLETLDKTPYKVHLNVIETGEDESLTTVLGHPELASADMVVAAYDSDFPKELIAFGERTGVEIINVFDSKDTSYTENARYVQLLPPSDIFFNSAADGVLRLFNGCTYIFIEEGASYADGISACLRDMLDDNAGGRILTLPDSEALKNYDFDASTRYVLVSELSARQPVMEMIGIVNDKKESIPGLEISVIGRPTWLVFSDSNAEELRKADTYFPSRFYLDASDPCVKAFEKRYVATYKSQPLKSLPAYAATGYDVASYFIDAYANARGDMNMLPGADGMLQLDFRLGNVNNWGGLLNKCIYLLHYAPNGTTQKIKL